MTSPPSRRTATVLRRAVRRPWLAALAGYCAAFVVLTWPLVTRMGSATYGGPGDGWALIWQTWSRERDGLSYFSSGVDPHVAYPFGGEIPSATLLSNVSTEWPSVALMRVGAGDVLANNIVLMAAGVLSALAMYAAVRRMGARPSVAFWAGLVYLIAPWELDRLAIHLTLSLLVAFPLMILGTVEWIRQPSLRAGALLVAATGLAVYTHGYYGLFAAAILLASLPAAAAVAVRRRSVRRDLVAMGGLTAGIAMVALPLALALGAQSGGVSQQLDRPLYLDDLALRLRLLVLPSVENPVLGGLTRSVIGDAPQDRNTGELALYLGWAAILLAVVGIWAAATRRAPRLPVAIGTVVALAGIAMALPATVDLPVLGATSMPVAYVQDAVSFVSTPARFFVLTLTGVTIVAALGLEALLRGHSQRTRTAVVAAVVAISLVEMPVWVDGRVVDTAPPEEIAALGDLVPPGAAVVGYPSVDRGLRGTADQLFWQRIHGRPLVNGAASRTPEDAVRMSVADPGRPETAGELALLGVRWALYQPYLRRYAPPQERAEVPADPPGFDVVRRYADGSSVMHVTAPPAPGIVALADGFEADGGSPGWRWAQGGDARLLVCTAAAGGNRVVLRLRAFAQPRTVVVAGRRLQVPATAEGTEVSVPLADVAGWRWVAVTLVGTEPTRPADVVPGSADTRRLAFDVSDAHVVGPVVGNGDGACHGPLPAVPA